MRTIATTIAAAVIAALVPTTACAADKPAPTETLKVIAFGDSITYGIGTDRPRDDSWPSQIGAERVAKAGAGLVGARAGKSPAIDKYRATVLPKDPDIVIVAYGMNDLYWSSTHEIMAGLRQVKRWNTARGIDTYVATLTPIGAEDTWNLDPYRVGLNERIRGTFGEQVIDFDAALANDNGELPERYDSGDSLHPNARAYQKMAKVADAAIR